MARQDSGSKGRSPSKIAFIAAVAALCVAAVVAAVLAVQSYMGMPGPGQAGGGSGDGDGASPDVERQMTEAEVYDAMTSANGGVLPDMTFDESGETVLFVDGRFTDRTIASGTDAVAAVGDVGPLFGVRDAAEELEPVDESAYEGVAYYRLQQKYQGLDVYGHQLVVSAKDGQAATLSGEFEPGISLDVDSAREQAGEDADLVVYVPEDGSPTVAVRGPGVDGIALYSLETGEVLYFDSRVHFDGAVGHATVDGASLEFDTTRRDDGSYELRDSGRNLTAHDVGDRTLRRYRFLDSGNSRVIAGYSSRYEAWIVFADHSQTAADNYTQDSPRSSDPTYTLRSNSGSTIASGLTWSSWSSEKMVYADDQWSAVDVLSNNSDDWSSKPEAAKAMASVQRLYDYYAGRLDWQGFDNANSPFYIVVRDNMDGERNCYSSYDIISFSTSFGVVDVVAGHEFAHSIVGGVMGEDNQLEYKGESGALHEAYADVMGILATNTASWRIEDASRYLDDPASKGTQCAYYKGSNWVDTSSSSDHGGVHTNATVIGHAAYLMNAKGVTMNDLAKIWFTSLNYLTPKASFATCRAAVISAAEELGYDEATLDIIRASFDEVGVGSSGSGAIALEARIVATDLGGNRRMNFTVEMTRVLTDEERSRSFSDSMGSMYRASTTTGYLDLKDVFGDDFSSLPYYSTWSVKLTDGDDPSASVTRRVVISSAGVSRLHMRLNIAPVEKDVPNNPPDQLTRDIVLVLDDSGSMAGDPVEEVRTASSRFAETVFGHNARVSVVSFESAAKVETGFTDNQGVLDQAVEGLDAAGGTNIEDGLKEAEDLLAGSTADRRIIILMTDGEPNNGLVGDDLVRYADDIKASGVYVYTLGFFSGLQPGTKSEPQQLLERIASEGCHYEITDASDLQFFFGDIADEINGVKYNYIRIACPVDVSVTYNGETLSSAGATGSARTSFGTLTFEEAAGSDSDDVDESGEVEQVKILRLLEGPEYEVSINGTGKGVMNYQIGFVDDAGTYSDMRYFDDIAIEPRTKISTVAAVGDQTTMRVDSDGDGKVDKTYVAAQNSHAMEIDNTRVATSAMNVVLFGALSVACVIVAVWLLLVRRSRKNATRAK